MFPENFFYLIIFNFLLATCGNGVLNQLEDCDPPSLEKNCLENCKCPVGYNGNSLGCAGMRGKGRRRKEERKGKGRGKEDQ
jgi:hypothetical protein